MTLRAVHRNLGLATFAVFLITGTYLKLSHDQLIAHGDVIRFLFRANHVYILCAAMLHVVLGTYLVPSPGARGRRVQRVGSGLMIAATAVLVVAFVVEPARAGHPRLITGVGFVLLFAGVVCHFLARRRGGAGGRDVPG